jgi:hypothetical protein
MQHAPAAQSEQKQALGGEDAYQQSEIVGHIRTQPILSFVF